MDSDTCADCGAPEPCMHNSREVGKATQRFPGYLCVSCWKLANPNLFPGFYVKKGENVIRPKRLTPPVVAVIMWAVFIIALIVVCLVSYFSH